MNAFVLLVNQAVVLRRSASPSLFEVAHKIGSLYVDPQIGGSVRKSLVDQFFPLTLFVRHYLSVKEPKDTDVPRCGQNLAWLGQMHLRIRKDIGRHVGNHRATCVDLDGDAHQEVSLNQWCSLCGQCCWLSGTVPDAPDGMEYPGYWYAWIAGDGPVRQRFCPFLFELPPRELFFCSIHKVKPRTCRAYGEEACRQNHSGLARCRRVPAA